MPVTTTPDSTSSKPTTKLDCDLCVHVAWKGPLCTKCAAAKKQHYTEGLGATVADFFCVAESPYIGNISGSVDTHTGWQVDIEKTIRMFFMTVKSANSDHRALEGRFTYAVRCNVDKPPLGVVKNCSALFIPELLEYARPDIPIHVFALGPMVAKTLGLSFRKYATIQGKFIATTLQGRKIYVFPSFSKRQLVAKTGFVEIMKQHIRTFLNGVSDTRKGVNIQAGTTIEELTKHYIYPKTLVELSNTIDTILGHARPGRDPEDNILALDTETNTKYPHRDKLKLISLNVAWDPGRAASFLVEHPEAAWTPEEVRPYIARILQSPNPKVFQNGQYDLKVLWKKGYGVRKFAWDTMAGEHILAEDKRGFYGLKTLTRDMAPEYAGYEDQIKEYTDKAEAVTLTKQLKAEKPVVKGPKVTGAAKKLAEDTEADGFANIPVPELLTYGAIDADVTRIICGHQRARMIAETVQYRAEQAKLARSPKFVAHGTPRTDSDKPLEMLMVRNVVPSIKALAAMESYGVPVDREYLADLSRTLEGSIAISKAKLMSMVAPHTLPAGFARFPSTSMSCSRLGALCVDRIRR